jgi:CopG family nickel-responsive transcriptional regulator
MTLKRFGVSIPEDLLQEFDKIVEERNYVGRSEAIRDAMRAYISQCEWEVGDQTVMASLNLVYTHKPRLMEALIKAQHNSEANVISTIHVHVSQSLCLEVITLSGSKEDITKLANKISGISGIEFVRLFAFSLPDDAAIGHSYAH